MITREQEQVLLQSERILHAKLEILDPNLNIIREMTGDLVSGSYTVSAKVGARRTCSIKLRLSEDNLPSATSPIWINKRFRLYIGITNLRTDEIVWFIIGTYAISEPSRDIELSGKDTLSIKGTDFVAFMDDTLGGGLDKNYKINCGDYVYNAIQNTFNEFTSFKTNIIANSLTIPYEFEKDMGDSQWDIIEELLELYLHYEGFFDEYGTFVYQQASDLITDSVVWDFSQDTKNLIVDYSIDYNWDDVRNRITCIGKEDDGVYPYYTEVAVSSSDIWADCPFTVDRLGEVKTYDYVVPDVYVDLAWDNIQGATSANSQLGKLKTLIEENGWDKETGIDKTVGEYVRQCFLGQITESDLKVKLTALNLDSYFEHLMTSVDTGIYRANPRSMTIKESKYYKKEQCVTRVQYELDKRLACAETVKITTAPIYGLDANQLIYLKIDGDLTGKYCIDNISCKLETGGTMDITCHKVTQNRYAIDQAVLYETEGSEYIKVIDYDGTVSYVLDNRDVFDNVISVTTSLKSIFSAEMIYEYRLSLRDEWEIKQLLFIDSDAYYRIDKPKSEEALYMYCPASSPYPKLYERLYRDDSRNWYTDTYAIGQDLSYDAGWIGTTDLPSFWEETIASTGDNYVLSAITDNAFDSYLPYPIVEKYNLTKDEAKAMSWVGCQYGRLTTSANNFDRKVAKRYVLCYTNKNMGVLKVREFTNSSKTETNTFSLYRDDDGNWYTDNYWYGQSIFSDEGWVGDEPTDKPKADFTLEENGYLRLSYDSVMSGKVSLSE